MMIMMDVSRRQILYTIHLMSTTALCPLPDTPWRQRDILWPNHVISTDVHFPQPDTPIIPYNPENAAPDTMLYYPGITISLSDTPAIKYFTCFYS